MQLTRQYFDDTECSLFAMNESGCVVIGFKQCNACRPERINNTQPKVYNELLAETPQALVK